MRLKRLITALAVILSLAGCSTNANATNATNTTANRTANNAVSATTNGTAAASNSTTGSQTSSPALSNAQMQTVAKDVMQRYVLSHNDKTESDYKVDLEQILVPGLAQNTAAIAQSGSDFNHPVHAYTLQVSSVQALDDKTLRAKVNADIHFTDGTTETRTYALMLIQYDDMWLIRTIS